MASTSSLVAVVSCRERMDPCSPRPDLPCRVTPVPRRISAALVLCFPARDRAAAVPATSCARETSARPRALTVHAWTRRPSIVSSAWASASPRPSAPSRPTSPPPGPWPMVSSAQPSHVLVGLVNFSPPMFFSCPVNLSNYPELAKLQKNPQASCI